MHINRFRPQWAISCLFWASLAVYLAVLHIGHTIAIRNLALFGMLAATSLLLIKSKQRPEFPFWVPWVLYVAVSLISITYSVDPDYSLRNIQAELGYAVLVLVVSASWSRWSPAFNSFLLVLIAVNIFLELATYSAASFSDPMSKTINLPPLAGAGVNPNFLVSVLPLMVLAAFWCWQRRLFIYLCIVSVLIAADVGALILSYNRQSFIAVLTSILCAGILTLKYRFSWRRLGVFLGLVVLATTLIGLQLSRRAQTDHIDQQDATATATFSNDIRWKLWEFSLDKIEKKPFSGSGFGRETFGKAYPEVFNINPMLWHAHNLVINKGVQMGIPGIIAFLFLWFAILREFGRHLGTTNTRHAIAVACISLTVAVFMKNMTDDHFVRDPAYLFWLLIGMSVGSLRRLESGETIGKW